MTNAHRTLTAEQMAILGWLNMDFIGWQEMPNGKALITANDRQTGNATYFFDYHATAPDILDHVVKKRRDFNSHTPTEEQP